MTKVILFRILGVVSIVLGFMIVAWFGYNQFFPTAEYQQSFRSYLQLLVPAGCILIGWVWLKYDGSGIETMPADFSCQELVDSVASARKSLPEFIAEVEKNVDQAFIKFPMDVSNGGVEHIWAYVHSYKNNTFNVSLANDPYDSDTSGEGRRDVTADDVEDWQIMLPDGRIRGAYSLMALFQYHENRGKSLTPRMKQQKAQLIDM